MVAWPAIVLIVEDLCRRNESSGLFYNLPPQHLFHIRMSHDTSGRITNSADARNPATIKALLISLCLPSPYRHLTQQPNTYIHTVIRFVRYLTRHKGSLY